MHLCPARACFDETLAVWFVPPCVLPPETRNRLAVGALCWYVFGTAIGDIAARMPMSRKGYRVGSVPGVISEGFHARVRGDTAVVGQPARVVDCLHRFSK